MMKPKGRPKKQRVIDKEPDIRQFSPRGKPGRPDEVELGLDHFEAIRLADYEGLEQEAAAGPMGISRQTFGRILKAARHVIAEGLAKGKIIRINSSPDNPPGK
jgi:predicted DNA-binding protein (UPF0251 family)